MARHIEILEVLKKHGPQTSESIVGYLKLNVPQQLNTALTRLKEEGLADVWRCGHRSSSVSGDLRRHSMWVAKYIKDPPEQPLLIVQTPVTSAESTALATELIRLSGKFRSVPSGAKNSWSATLQKWHQHDFAPSWERAMAVMAWLIKGTDKQAIWWRGKVKNSRKLIDFWGDLDNHCPKDSTPINRKWGDAVEDGFES